MMNSSDMDVQNYTYYDYETICDLSGTVESPLFYYVLFFLGALGNITVLWVLLRYIKLKTMTDACLLNLALSDLILAVSLPIRANTFHNLVSCKLIIGVYQLGFFSGTLFVTLMSVDRYLAIVHAVAAMRARTLCYGIIASIIVWVISIIMAMPQVIFASLEMENEDNHSKCDPHYPEDTQQFWKKMRNFTENTVGLFVGLPIMIFCYVKILLVLSKSRNSKKDKAVKLIFTIVCVFVLCWVPYNVSVFLQTLQLFDILNTCEDTKIINSATYYAEIIALTHCCVNPIIYAFIGEKFRNSLGKRLTKYFFWSAQHGGAFSHRDTTDKDTSNTPVRSEY